MSLVRESEVAGELESEKRSAYIKMVLSGTFFGSRRENEVNIGLVIAGARDKNKPGHT